MKKIAVMLALLLAFSCLSGCLARRVGHRKTETGVPDTVPATTAPTAAEEIERLPDFTVRTVDGGTFTLSEALKDHELVLINLFATWCGPCAMEFPYLQEAWSQNEDRVAVIALSVESEDTEEVLRAYAEERELTFPIGREEGTDLRRFVTEGIPTTVLVDRTGKVAAVEIGAKTSTGEFLKLFDGFSGEDYDPSVCTYTVILYDRYTYDEIPGAVVNFCTDTVCTPITTDENGAAVFTGAPARYHVQIVGLPEGCSAGEAADFTTEPYGQTFWIPVEGTGR